MKVFRSTCDGTVRNGRGLPPIIAEGVETTDQLVFLTREASHQVEATHWTVPVRCDPLSRRDHRQPAHPDKTGQRIGQIQAVVMTPTMGL